MKPLAAVIVAMATAAATAGEILETEVLHSDGRYRVRFDVRLDAPRDRLTHHLTDYAQYATHFHAITESEVLGPNPDGSLRVRLRLDSCLLFYCRSVTQVKDITERPDGVITARIDPAQSDFHESVERWHIAAEDGATRLRYEAELVPKFYVPPLIGPWLIKRQIRASLANGSAKLEALARE